MPAAEIGELRLEALLIDVAGRLGRQDRSERGARQAQRRAKARAGRFEKGAALADIARDVFEIGLRDHPAAAVAVEDDQVEFVELDVEQFADRKGDQRQFADRRAVLLFRRPQDREMDEIDRGVGFEDVAPDPLAGMRLARDQQHPQAVAHAVDDDHRVIVVEGQLARARLDRELENVGPAVIDRQAQRNIAADRHRDLPRRAAVLAPGDDRLARAPPSCFPGGFRQVLDPDLQLQLPCRPGQSSAPGRRRAGGRLRPGVPDSRTWSGAPTVSAAALASPAGTSCTCPSVIMTTAGETLPRHVGHRPGEGGEQARSVVAGTRLRLSGPDHAHIEIALAGEAVAERRQRLLRSRAGDRRCAGSAIRRRR